ncbi:hypothetical protein PTTG_00891 [Puccinia triticina 1-1 BBBD Race 1]|uniref:Uncharacterized protein n=2 Tax=Puccinia triticina TaxID=208348 RepID=A0A0C4EJH3_PUCT1|nr:uncharacterized protein PtA15_13A88 [Puccinia triticina]OAV93279.1 hypothetical protein PTTG_00891 [Puccinia triticina 1-1 BBBD Race 1]WAQ90689.1 hypothetical protein PtA15_13A88 [Puccinia triticina]WAR60844.1 hypothetical protein PtB15_13B90 [Puccinia triticina]
MSTYNHTLGSSSAKEHHRAQMPFTPPHSTRSAFAELPLTQKDPPRNKPGVPAGKRSASAHTDDSGSESGSESDDEGYDDSDAGSERGRPYAAREPAGVPAAATGSSSTSPDPEEAFTAEDSPFATLEPGLACESQHAIYDLAGAITHALTEYRQQFERWEATPNPPRSVVRASILIDQAFARFIFALEPFKHTAKAVHSLAHLISELGSFLTQHRLTDSTQLWNGLGRLADEISQAEDGLGGGLQEIGELNDWVDALLTPALAEVKFLRLQPADQVSAILDVHSYLCDSLARAAQILAVFRAGLAHTARAIAGLQAALLDHQPGFPLEQTIQWSATAAASLSATADAIALFCSISDYIQASSRAGPAAATAPDSNPHPSCHAISY